MFRKLKANEIDVRVQSISEKGAVLLLYKDARCDQKILDETVGAMNWQRKHDVVADNLFCTVSIYNAEINQWVSKQDVGVESFTEKVKGEASDSFKRACFNWGIGRELYTTGFVFIKNVEKHDHKGKLATYDKFSVSEITYNSNDNIENLIIKNQNNEVVYNRVINHQTPLNTPPQPKPYKEIELEFGKNLQSLSVLKSFDIAKFAEYAGFEKGNKNRQTRVTELFGNTEKLDELINNFKNITNAEKPKAFT